MKMLVYTYKEGESGKVQFERSVQLYGNGRKSLIKNRTKIPNKAAVPLKVKSKIKIRKSHLEYNVVFTKLDKLNQ